MIYYNKNKDGLTMVKLDKETEQEILKQASEYQIVKTRTITWEKLDEDRYGEDTDVFNYPLSEPEKCSLDFCIIIQDNKFFGVKLYYENTKSWNAGLNKEKSLFGCSLYIDGSSDGSIESKSSYDSPNNYDEVVTTYSISKIKK